MPSSYIKMEHLAGTDYKTAIHNMIQLSRKTGADVASSHNGIDIYVVPNTRAEDAVKRYEQDMFNAAMRQREEEMAKERAREVSESEKNEA